MRKGFAAVILRSCGIVAVLTVGACSSEPEAPPVWLTLPALEAFPALEAPGTHNEAENLPVIVTTTDISGRGPDDAGFAGATLNGQCRAYLDNNTPVTTSEEFFDRAFGYLDQVIIGAGGVERILETPELIPAAHILGDVNTPWRCVAGAIFNVQKAGYPTVGFAVQPIDPDAAGSRSVEAHLLYFNFPVSESFDSSANGAANKVLLTSKNEIRWNGKTVTPRGLAANLLELQTPEIRSELQFEAEADTSYDLAIRVLAIVRQSNDGYPLNFVDSEEYRSFGKGEN